MKDILFAILAAVFAALAAFFFYSFQIQEDEGLMNMILGGLFIVLAVVCGVLFMTKKVNKSEDIHITE